MRVPNESEIRDMMNTVPMGQFLSDKDMELMKKNSRAISYSKGETIFKQGAAINEMAFLARGLAKVMVENPMNDTATIIQITKPVTAFFISAIFEDTYRATAVAMTDSVVVFVDKETWVKIVKNNTKCLYTLLQGSCIYSSRIVDQLVDFGQKSIKARLASTILNISDFIGGDYINIPLSRNDLAEYAGIATGSAIRVLAELSKEKVISLEKKTIRIVNREDLIRISKD